MKQDKELLQTIFKRLSSGEFTQEKPLVGLLFRDTNTEACTCYKNKVGTIACCLPAGYHSGLPEL